MTKTRKLTVAVITGIVSLPLTVITLIGTWYVHLKLYAFFNPNAALTLDKNYYLAEQIKLHALIAVPLIYVVVCILIWRWIVKWFD